MLFVETKEINIGSHNFHLNHGCILIHLINHYYVHWEHVFSNTEKLLWTLKHQHMHGWKLYQTLFHWYFLLCYISYLVGPRMEQRHTTMSSTSHTESSSQEQQINNEIIFYIKTSTLHPQLSRYSFMFPTIVTAYFLLLLVTISML